MNEIYRNGDLVFRPVRNMEGKIVNHNGSFILARGEVTNHCHRITAERMEIRQTEDGRFYLALESEGVMTHEDHETITIAPGIYEVGHEREMDWFSKAVRKVVD